MEIEYRDLTTRYPRLVRKIEARLGDFSGRGKNKTEAKAKLIASIEAQSQHLFSRRYLVGPRGTFALHYTCGWRYDIIPMDDPNRWSSCILGDDLTEDEAYELMLVHFQEYQKPGSTTTS